MFSRSPPEYSTYCASVMSPLVCAESLSGGRVWRPTLPIPAIRCRRFAPMASTTNSRSFSSTRTPTSWSHPLRPTGCSTGRWTIPCWWHGPTPFADGIPRPARSTSMSSGTIRDLPAGGRRRSSRASRYRSPDQRPPVASPRALTGYWPPVTRQLCPRSDGGSRTGHTACPGRSLSRSPNNRTGSNSPSPTASS